jgi:hypothetical protein
MDSADRMEMYLAIHEELAKAKEQIMIDVMLELITLIGDDESISQEVKDRINARYDELENTREFKPKM